MIRIKKFAQAHPNITTVVLLLALFGLVQLFLGSRPTPLDTTADLQAMLTDGQPTVVEFYSNL